MSAWSMELAEDWQQRQEEEAVTFYHPDGVGTLQISAYEADEAIVPADLDQLAELGGPAAADYQPVTCGEFSGKACEQLEDDELWQFWFIAAADCALAITYSCNYEDRNQEARTIKAMLDSLALGEGEGS